MLVIEGAGIAEKIAMETRLSDVVISRISALYARLA